MTIQELTQLVALGEGERLEFKRRVPEGARIAREAIALANTNGGRLMLGVSDDGTIVGLRDAAEEAFALRRSLDRYCRPPVEYTTERVPVEGRRDVVVVFIPESRNKPHLLKDSTSDNGTGDGVAYVRAGEMSVEASKESVQLMKPDEGGGVTFEFGEKETLLMRYLEDYARITVGEFAQLAGISDEEASATLLALAKADILNLQAARRDDYFTLALPSE